MNDNMQYIEHAFDSNLFEHIFFDGNNIALHVS